MMCNGGLRFHSSASSARLVNGGARTDATESSRGAVRSIGCPRTEHSWRQAPACTSVRAQSTLQRGVFQLSPGIREWHARCTPPSPRPAAGGRLPCSAAFSSVLTEAFSPGPSSKSTFPLHRVPQASHRRRKAACGLPEEAGGRRALTSIL